MRHQPFRDSDLLARWVIECLAQPKPKNEPTISEAGAYIVATIAMRGKPVRGLGRDYHEAASRARSLAGRKN